MKVKKSSISTVSKVQNVGSKKNKKTKEQSPSVIGVAASQTPLADPVRPRRNNAQLANAIPLLGYSQARTNVMERLDT